MEDENGIELSLGLSCGGSSGKSKAKDGSSDIKADEGGTNKLIGGGLNVADVSLKHFLHPGVGKQDSSSARRSESGAQPQESFWTDLGKQAGQEAANVSMDVHGNNKQFTNYQELWGGKNRSSEIEEEKSDQHEISTKLWPDANNKRKMPFEEITHHRKHEREVEHDDAHSKTKDGSSVENEDVAESEAEGSTSRLASQHEEGSKQYKSGGSDVHKIKDKQRFGESGINVAGNESGLELGNLAYGVPFSLQQPPAVPVPYSLPGKIPAAPTAPSSSGFPLPCVMQLMPPANNERPAVQSVNPSGFQLAFGYSPVQLPTLDTGSSWGAASHPRQLPAFAPRSLHDGVPNADRSADGLHISRGPVPVPHHVPEEPGTSSSLKEDEAKGTNTMFKPKEISDQPAIVEGLSHEFSAIRPGAAPSLKFGGSGSCPDLPWVSTTGPGPNGKTISGVTYRYGQSQIRIVCACHGTHMSPEEFIQHANADATNSENSAGLPSFPTGNPAASAAQT